MLTEQASATDLSDRLKLQTQRAEESVQFIKSLDKWYHRGAEKFFLLLVFIDAIITALKYTNMDHRLALTLQIWQVILYRCVSIHAGRHVAALCIHVQLYTCIFNVNASVTVYSPV